MAQKTKAKPYVIALEEHYHDSQIVSAMGAAMEGRKNPEIAKRLDDLGALRSRKWTRPASITRCCRTARPRPSASPADSALQIARGVNDRLHEAVTAHPKRFGAFAALPTTTDAKLAADELERCVTKLGFVGAMIHGLSTACFSTTSASGRSSSAPRRSTCRSISTPPRRIRRWSRSISRIICRSTPALGNAAWGFTIETATLGIRLILSGVLDAYPKVKIILGHLGEGLPFFLWRINMTLARDGKQGEGFREKFLRQFLPSPPAGSSPTTRSIIASRRSGSTASCSRSIIPSSRTRRAPNGCSTS